MSKPLFDHVLRGGVIAMAACAPWFFGGVEARTEGALMLCAGLVLSGWLFFGSRKEEVPLPLAALPLLAALGLALLQLTPLPDDTLSVVSPGARQLWSELTDVASVAGHTSTVSLYPASTRHDLGRLALGLALFVIGACLFASERTFLTACVIVSLNGAVLAVFGMVQRLTWNGHLFWTLPLKDGVPFGPFVNKNNACGYLHLCLAAALGVLVWTFNRRRRFSSGRLLAGWTVSQLAALVLTGCVVAGILSSMSRGGLLALIGATLLTLVILQSRRQAHAAWTLGAVMLLAMAIVFWTGAFGDVGARFSTLFEPGSSDVRFAHWREVLRACPNFWLLGSGLGTYRYVYPVYQQSPHEFLFYHAENQFLEALLEGGIFGLILLLLAIGALIVAISALLRRADFTGALLPAVVGSYALASQLIAGAFDFGLYLPANMLLMALLAGAVSGWAARQAPGRFVRLPGTRWLLPSLVALLALLNIWGMIDSWNVHARKKATAIDAPLSPHLETAAAIGAQIQELQSAVSRRWDDAEGHRDMAALWIKLYQARAVEDLQKRFPQADPQALWNATAPEKLHQIAARWLQAGNSIELARLRSDPAIAQTLPAARAHLLLAREACPLLSDVHRHLAELSLVLEGIADADATHVRRAVRVQPTSAACRYYCGRLDLSAGRIGEACHHWRRSLELSSRHEADILDAARTELTTEELVDEVLPPSPQVLVRIARQRAAEEPDGHQLNVFLSRATELLDQRNLPEAERHYLRASISTLAGETAAALDDYARAIELNPNEISWRYEYALALFEAGRLDEALTHGRWCARRNPQSVEYGQLLQRIHQLKLRQP